jgi:hypothetical protein
MGESGQGDRRPGGLKTGLGEMVEINIPEVLAEVTAACKQYERALVGNDVTVLDKLFWHSPHTIRYGAGEVLYGYEEIAQFRAARSPAGLARTVSREVITSYGRDFATSSLQFERNGRSGRQMQTWARMPEGWRVVAAHVSMM